MRERLNRLKALLVRRLRNSYQQAIAFGLIGAIAGQLTAAAEWPERIGHMGWSSFLQRITLDLFVVTLAAMCLTFGFRLCVERPAELVRRPWKFITILVFGTALVSVLAWTTHGYLSSGMFDGAAARPDRVVNFWLQAMLYGGLIGWMYLLSLQRAEDQALLGALMGRRMLLARQLARSRLGTARARIDPAMVARVLAEVHARYRTEPAQAAILLDHLISYLRLAMNRARIENPTVAGELALIRSLAAMREVQYGIVVQVNASLTEADTRAQSGPLFLVASALLDEAIGTGARSARLRIAKSPEHIGIELEAAVARGSSEKSQALAGAIAKLLPAGLPPLEQFIETGINRYVVKQI